MKYKTVYISPKKMKEKTVQLVTVFLLSDGVLETTSSVTNANHVRNFLFGAMKANATHKCLCGLKIG